MKEKLIIISDLWGKGKSEWLNNYLEILEERFSIEFYDSCELAAIDKSEYTQENLHRQFVNGGIEKAVDKLIELEKDPLNILAFSIGGTIAWRFGIRTDKVSSLICISSTRLRKETEKPKGTIQLFYGENDAFIPEKDWFEKMDLEYTILENQGHQVYCDPVFAKQLSQEIIKTTPIGQ